MISRSNLPPSEAESARRCDSSEYASSSSRDRCHSSASSSADVPCITMSYRSVTRSEIEPPFDPIGTRDIISTPAETTRSSCPASTAAAALKLVCIDEPHCRSTVVAETETGQPAASTAIRPTFQPCSPIWVTQPICTSSISAGSRPCRPTRPFRTCAARSSPRSTDRAPFLRPIGARTASTMYAAIGLTLARSPRLLRPAVEQRPSVVQSASAGSRAVTRRARYSNTRFTATKVATAYAQPAMQSTT